VTSTWSGHCDAKQHLNRKVGYFPPSDDRTMTTRLFPAVGLAVLVASGCATVQTTRPGEICVARGQSMLVTLGDMNRAAAQEYANLLAQARRGQSLDPNTADVTRVRAIMNRLIAQTRGVSERRACLALGDAYNRLSSSQCVVYAWG
jgi:hypothetical protein